MNVKNLACIAALAFAATGNAFAQDDCMSNMSIYQEYYKQKNYKDAYLPWKAVMDNASCKHNMALYQKGATILQNLVYSETNAANKKAKFNELMALWDERISKLDQLNATVRTKSTLGDMYCRKAYDYITYGAGCGATNDVAYTMFRKGIDIIAQKDDENVQGFVLSKYFDVSYAKYQADPEGFREQFLKDYMETTEICEKMLAAANNEPNPAKAKQIVDQYDPVQSNAEATLAVSKAAEPEMLNKMFTPKIEANKNDVDYLNSVLSIMSANNATKFETYYKAAKYAHAIKPTYESAIGCAADANRNNQAAAAAKYYDQALTLCPNEQQKAKICLQVAKAMLKSGNTGNAEKYLSQATTITPALAGKADMIRAQIAAVNGNYDSAINLSNKAAQEDVTLTGQAERMNKQMAEAKVKKAAQDKYNAAVKAEQAKKAKEEAFWKGGK